MHRDASGSLKTSLRQLEEEDEGQEINLEASQYYFDSDRVSVLPLLLVQFVKALDLYSMFDLSPTALYEFATKLENGYLPDNPFHNAAHACDVMQACVAMMNAVNAQKANRQVFNMQNKLCL